MAFILSNMNNLIKKAFTQMLGEPEMSYIQRNDEKDLNQPYQKHLWNSAHTIKLADFGESFLPTMIPQTLRTPLSVRAPEVVFQDCSDCRVDLWSMGCMLFELFVGQHPFDTLLITPAGDVATGGDMTNKPDPVCRNGWKSGVIALVWVNRFRALGNGEDARNSGV
ncbi:hypothetical protein I7I51_06210 [Histoplasma capsulatum]|uniref:Protein kinase domain-containing protein n=1 Tax=Ajellomyces capsulatus TaxID=5037 RepID=A0A8A1MFG8_AJECA|nr:hypothetical protein I7I51_06210 [Histoplasma capsulatum]